MVFIIIAVVLSLDAADLKIAAKLLSAISGQAVILSADAGGKVSVQSGDVKNEEAVKLLIAAITASGNTVTRKEGYYEIAKATVESGNNRGDNGNSAPSAVEIVPLMNPEKDICIARNGAYAQMMSRDGLRFYWIYKVEWETPERKLTEAELKLQKEIAERNAELYRRAFLGGGFTPPKWHTDKIEKVLSSGGLRESVPVDYGTVTPNSRANRLTPLDKLP